MGYTKAKINVSRQAALCHSSCLEGDAIPFLSLSLFLNKQASPVWIPPERQLQECRNYNVLHLPQSPPHSRCWINICRQNEYIYVCPAAGQWPWHDLTDLEIFSPEQSKSFCGELSDRAEHLDEAEQGSAEHSPGGAARACGAAQGGHGLSVTSWALNALSGVECLQASLIKGYLTTWEGKPKYVL